MLTVVIYILRRLVDQDSPSGLSARLLLESIVGRMKNSELAKLKQEEARLRASGRSPRMIDAGEVDLLEDIGFRHDRLLDAGIDDFLRLWWFHLQLPGDSGPRSASLELVEAIGWGLIGKAAGLCRDFLVEDKPEIGSVNNQRAVEQLEKLIGLADSASGVNEEVLNNLRNTFLGWSACGSEWGRPPWSYRGFDLVVPPSD